MLARMNARAVILVLLPIVAAAAALAAAAESAQSLQAQVVGINSGDTLTVLDADYERHKVRLAGIDAPGEGPALRRTGAAAAGSHAARQECSCRMGLEGSQGASGREALACNARRRDRRRGVGPARRGPGVALPAIRERAVGRRPPPLRVRRATGPRQPDRPLERYRSCSTLGLAAWCEWRSRQGVGLSTPIWNQVAGPPVSARQPRTRPCRSVPSRSGRRSASPPRSLPEVWRRSHPRGPEPRTPPGTRLAPGSAATHPGSSVRSP